MAVICNTCGLPEDLCACGELAKDSTKIIIRLETRRFKKKGTMIEGLDPKLIIILVLSLASSPHAHKSSGRPQVLQITAIRSKSIQLFTLLSLV
jgi:hypothetical protein